MTHYQIVYSKRGYPLFTWADDAEHARKLADNLRKVGYFVDVWAHNQDGARKTDL